MRRNYIVFAYGSNMNQRQMALRCPDATPICVARLDQHELTFAGLSPRWGGGIATVVPSKRANVTGILWRLSGKDLERLDEYEGYPFVYDRMPVSVHTTKGTEVWCHTYVKNTIEFRAPPSEEYLRTIIDGYQSMKARVPKKIKKLYAEACVAN